MAPDDGKADAVRRARAKTRALRESLGKPVVPERASPGVAAPPRRVDPPRPEWKVVAPGPAPPTPSSRVESLGVLFATYEFSHLALFLAALFLEILLDGRDVWPFTGYFGGFVIQREALDGIVPRGLLSLTLAVAGLAFRRVRPWAWWVWAVYLGLSVIGGVAGAIEQEGRSNSGLAAYCAVHAVGALVFFVFVVGSKVRSAFGVAVRPGHAAPA